MKSASPQRRSDPGAEPAVQAPHPEVSAQPADAGEPARNSRPLEIGAALVVAAVTAAVYFLAKNIDVRIETPGVGPRTWPELLGAAGFGFSALLLLMALFGRTADRSDLDGATRTGWVRLLVTLAATVAFIVLWPVVGFIYVAPLLISAVTAIAGGRTIRALAVYPILATAGIYVLFHLLLKVPL